MHSLDSVDPTEYGRAAAQAHQRCIHEALDMGVPGLLLASPTRQELIDAFKTAIHGGVYLSPRARAVLSYRSPVSEITSRLGSGITTREMEVLRNLARGLQYKEIAD